MTGTSRVACTRHKASVAMALLLAAILLPGCGDKSVPSDANIHSDAAMIDSVSGHEVTDDGYNPELSVSDVSEGWMSDNFDSDYIYVEGTPEITFEVIKKFGERVDRESGLGTTIPFIFVRFVHVLPENLDNWIDQIFGAVRLTRISDWTVVPGNFVLTRLPICYAEQCTQPSVVQYLITIGPDVVLDQDQWYKLSVNNLPSEVATYLTAPENRDFKLGHAASIGRVKYLTWGVWFQLTELLVAPTADDAPEIRISQGTESNVSFFDGTPVEWWTEGGSLAFSIPELGDLDLTMPFTIHINGVAKTKDNSSQLQPQNGEFVMDVPGLDMTGVTEDVPGYWYPPLY